MGSRFTRLRRLFAMLAAFALVGGTVGVVGMLPAGLAGAQEEEEEPVEPADPEEICFRLIDGVIIIGSTDIEIPAAGTGFCGTLDDETGEFTGDLEIGPLLGVDFPPVELNISFVASNFGAQFALPNDDESNTAGDVSMNFNLAVSIEIIGVATCSLPSTALSPSTANSGGSPFDPEAAMGDWVFTVAQSGFNVGAVTDCPLAAVLNDSLGLPTSNTSVAMTFEAGDIPAPADPPPPEVETEVEPEVGAGAEADTDVLGAEAAEAAEADELPFTGIDPAVLLIAAAMALGVGFLFLSASRLVPARADRRR